MVEEVEPMARDVADLWGREGCSRARELWRGGGGREGRGEEGRGGGGGREGRGGGGGEGGREGVRDILKSSSCNSQHIPMKSGQEETILDCR